MFETKAVIYYNRYVDDILIIFNSSIIIEEQIINMMNSIHSNLLFTRIHKNNNCINFLDLLIIKKEDKLEIDIYIYIYRKLTTTDSTIHLIPTAP
jgi:hypothetical protein